MRAAGMHTRGGGGESVAVGEREGDEAAARSALWRRESASGVVWGKASAFALVVSRLARSRLAPAPGAPVLFALWALSACDLTLLPLIASPPAAGVCFQTPGLKPEDIEGEPAEAARALETARAVEQEREDAQRKDDKGKNREAKTADAGTPDAAMSDAGASELSSFDPEIGAAMRRLGYSTPMPVQKAAWPALTEGRDVVAVAEPGAGKTIAYLLPAALRVAEARRAADDARAPRAHPVALVLVPTRELAQQVARDAREALRAKVGLLHGGVDKDEQVSAAGGRGGAAEPRVEGRGAGLARAWRRVRIPSRAGVMPWTVTELAKRYLCSPSRETSDEFGMFIRAA